MSSSIVKLISRSAFTKSRIRIRPEQQRSMSSTTTVQHISECFIKPRYGESKRRYYLTPLDMQMLCVHYSQVGLLFPKPAHMNASLIETLKKSLSETLHHFYPLAGQLATEVDEDQHQCSIFVDCHKGLGAKFIHTSALHVSILDILTPVYVPGEIVYPLFDHHEAVVNHNGHSLPLLSVQVTELHDGVFIGCSMNHAVADGTSFWNFMNVWSEIHRITLNNQATFRTVPRPPVDDRWFREGVSRGVTLPFTHPDELITRLDEGLDRTRMFHFSSESLVILKSKARTESIGNDNISTMQTLCALFWRAYVKANRLLHNDVTSCILVADDRHRRNPPLSPQYFGNFIELINNKIKVSDLVENNLGWAASLLNNSVTNHDDKAVRDYIQQWYKSRFVYQPADCFTLNNFMLINSPRFDVYDIDFGFGKLLAVRNVLKYGGVVAANSGCDGTGSIDLEICLSPDSMTSLESDSEFMSVVSVSS